MRRALLLLLGIVAITWLEFEVFPGHSYLEGATQIYLPVLERLDTPGFLSRDLVATHPHVSYTIYDEVTLFLREAGGMSFKPALLTQQVLCRAAAVTGVFLLFLAAGLDDILALVFAAWFHLGADLHGPCLLLAGREPTPRAFSFGLVLLAIGLIARERPLLSGLVAGLALLYDPVIAAPFWLVVLAAFLFDRKLRRLLRPALTILVVFVLLLANLAQLQPGITDSPPVFARLSAELAALQKLRTHYVWVSSWAGKDLWAYLGLFVCALWALTRIYFTLDRLLRWLFLGLSTCGVLAVAASAVSLDQFRWALIPRIEPAQLLLYTVAVASITCSIAGCRAASAHKWREAFAWFLVVAAIPVSAEFFDLLRPRDMSSLLNSAVWILLALSLIVMLRYYGGKRRPGLTGIAPVFAVILLAATRTGESSPRMDVTGIQKVAAWAESSTWGSSLFLFPDAGRALYPGVFRAESRRALWVDWESGVEVKYSEPVGMEWWHRWEIAMQEPFSPKRLQALLPLPIDYYVLKSSNRLDKIQPVFATSEFVVYDARDLRQAPAPLEFARR